MSTHKRRVRLAADLYEHHKHISATTRGGGLTIAKCAESVGLRPRHVAKEIARRKDETWAPHANTIRVRMNRRARRDFKFGRGIFRAPATTTK